MASVANPFINNLPRCAALTQTCGPTTLCLPVLSPKTACFSCQVLRLDYSRALVVLDPPTLRYFATGKFRPLKVETDLAAAAGVHRVNVSNEAASQDEL